MPMPKSITTPRGPVLAIKKATKVPLSILHFFMVQGVGFRCAAYCDQQGQWHDALNNQELYGDIGVIE